MTTKLLLGKDANGNVTYQIPFSDVGYQTTLTASVAQNLTVPPNATTAVFSYSSGGDVFVNPITTATLPTGSFVATYQQLNPIMRPVTAGTTLSFISAATAYVSVSFYQTLGFGLA